MSDLKKEFDPIINEAKGLGQKALKESIELSRKTLTTMLQGFGKALSSVEKKDVLDLYAEAEEHAAAGRSGVATAMAQRLDNYLASKALAGEAESLRAGRSFLHSLLNIVLGVGRGFLTLLGGPIVNKVADLGLGAVDKLLLPPKPPVKEPTPPQA